VAFDLLRDALSAIFGLSELKSEARSGRIPSRKILTSEGLAQRVVRSGSAPTDNMGSEYWGVTCGDGNGRRRIYNKSIIEGSTYSVGIVILDLTSSEQHIVHTITHSNHYYLSLYQAPSISATLKRLPELDTPPRRQQLLTTPIPGCEDNRQIGMIPAAAAKHTQRPKDRAAVRAEIEILRRERLAYEQESIQSRQDLARSEAYSRTLEARITLLETEACRHEWQRQAADDLAVQHIMHTQALEAG
ncbi:hypothetical protein Tco_1199408, partial [Tanacetum coccineum]